jgi:hypothetical protein
MISRSIDHDGRITIPGFYDNVEEVPQAEREMIAQIPFDEEKYKASIASKNCLVKKGIPHWSATVAVRLLTFVAFGWLYR